MNLLDDELIQLVKDAESGDLQSQNELAARYATGDDIERSLVKAVEWYKKAAQEYHPDALYNLGLMTLRGEGTEENTEEALRLLNMAVDCGSPDACLVIAEALRLGDMGLSVDFEKSTRCYLKAARLGAVTGIREIGELLYAKKISSDQLSKIMREFQL